MATEKRLIDANALVPYLWALFKFFGSLPCSEADKATQRGIKRCIGEINKMPTVDAVEVVHGRWLSLEEYAEKIGADRKIYVGGWVYCSECSQPMREINGWYYCPNCGAKMDGDGNDS